MSGETPQGEIAAAAAGGQRLYCLLALFDRRDGSPLAEMVRAAREGWERSSPEMAEPNAWDEFDARWARYTPQQRTRLALGCPHAPQTCPQGNTGKRTYAEGWRCDDCPDPRWS